MPPSSVRYPRPTVLAAGASLAGVLSVEINANNNDAADRFTVDVALAANAGLVAAGTIPIEIRVGLGGVSSQSLLTGRVDHLSIDPLRGTIRLDGRDRTADFIDTRTQETFANRTSSEVAALLANRHGLQASVTPTTTLIGRYYQAEHDHLTLDTHCRAATEWDLLTVLAAHEGFDVFVTGDTLVFQPKGTATPPIASITPSDCLDIRLDRALTLAGDIEVTVKSWNSSQQASVVATARAASRVGGARGSASSAPQQYVYVVPNLTPDAAQKLAQQRLAEISQHERVVTAVMPGELALNPRAAVTLVNTGTDFDQVYVIDRVERRISQRDGFRQTIRAKSLATNPS